MKLSILLLTPYLLFAQFTVPLARRAASGGGGGGCGSGSVTAQTVGYFAWPISMTVNSGDLIYVVLEGAGGPSSLPSTISDNGASGGNTYTQIDTTQSSALGNASIAHFYSIATKSATAINATGGGGVAYMTAVDFGSGCTALGGHVATGSISTATMTTGTFNTSGGTAGIIVAAASNYYNSTWTAGAMGSGTGTIPTGASFSGGDGSYNLATEYVTPSGTQTGITATLHNGATTTSGAILAAEFK